MIFNRKSEKKHIFACNITFERLNYAGNKRSIEE